MSPVPVAPIFGIQGYQTGNITCLGSRSHIHNAQALLLQGERCLFINNSQAYLLYSTCQGGGKAATKEVTTGGGDAVW